MLISIAIGAVTASGGAHPAFLAMRVRGSLGLRKRQQQYRQRMTRLTTLSHDKLIPLIARYEQLSHKNHKTINTVQFDIPTFDVSKHRKKQMSRMNRLILGHS